MCTKNDVLLIVATLAIGGSTWTALLESVARFL